MRGVLYRYGGVLTFTERKYLFFIIFIFIAACVETDIYLPAMADMMHYFQVSEEKIQSLLSWNFFGICLSSPIYGPISDAWGRKKPLMLALTLFFLGSLMTVYSSEFNGVLWGRILQGLGSGGCFTLGCAVIFDAFSEERAARAINSLNILVPTVMALAPMAGGYLNAYYGFRANFIAIAVLTLISLLITQFGLKETHAVEKRTPFELKIFLGHYRQTFTHGGFWRLTLYICLTFAVYMTFLSAMSILFIEELGVSKAIFPIYQGSILTSWLVASLFFRFFVDKMGNMRIRRSGLVLTAAGGLFLLIFGVIAPTSPLMLTIPVLICIFGVNWSQSLYFQDCMNFLPEIKGITASFITSIRLLISSVMVAVASHYYNATIYPTLVVVGIALAVSILLVIPFELSQRKETA